METLTPAQFKARYGENAVQNFGQPPAPEGGMGADISQSFKSGLNYAKEGYTQAQTATNPFTKLEAGLKEGAGVVGAAFSPLAPLTKYIGKGIDAAGNALSDTSLVKGAAGNLVTQPGGATSYTPNPIASNVMRGAEDVSNTSALLSLRGAPEAKISGINPLKGGVRLPSIQDRIFHYAKSVSGDVIPSSQRFINEEVAKALDLTPGDLGKISESTGNDVGQWLSDNNLIGKNKVETQSNIDSFFKKNYTDVRSNIDAVKTTYKQSQVPGYVDALKQIKNQVQDVPGMEKTAADVENMLNKKSITLNDVQKAKELLDEHYNLYKVTGDVAEGVAKKGLANIRGKIQGFIEEEVQKNGGVDIHAMNNAVSTAKSLGDAIITRDPKGLTRSNLRIGDMATFGLGSAYGGPAVGLALVFAKKLRESPTVRLRLARMVDKWNDAQKAKVASQLQQGVIPEEFAPFVKQKDKVGNQPSSLNSTKEVDPLAEEAKKYKSAEEFVKAKQKDVMYHGSPTPLRQFHNKTGAFFTSSMEDASGFAGTPDNVYEGYLHFKKPLVIDAKGAKWDELDTKYGKSTQEVAGNAQKAGFDGVTFKNIVDNVGDTADEGGQSTISYAFKPKDQFLNESQLTDIYHKATGKATPPTPQAKPKSE